MNNAPLSREAGMRLALSLAAEAAARGEVPVGCVVADGEGRVLGRGSNHREETGDATAHAEMEAIRQACLARGHFHLEDCTLFVTLEPCPMCAGALYNARVGTVVYGAREEKSGSLGSVVDLFTENFGYHPKVYGGVLAEECAALLKRFFEEKR